MSHDSYDAAAAVFAKARKPAEGKPLGVKGWRMFKDGDEYVVYCYSQQVARFLPGNVLRLALSSDQVTHSVSGHTQYVLPIMIVYRTKGHHRVHVKRLGSDRDYMTAESYGEFKTGGYRLHDGLTFDLNTRQAVGYKEPVLVTNADARKQWLRDSKKLKTYLNTLVRLGAFDARIEAFGARGASRWEFRPTEGTDVDAALLALRGGDPEPLVNRLAQLMYRVIFRGPDHEEQSAVIAKFLSTHSFAMRKALGVVKQQ